MTSKLFNDRADKLVSADQLLLEATIAGNTQDVARLVAAEADVNHRDENGMTPLHHAAASGERGCLRILVACGRCDYLIRDRLDRYASDIAIEWGRDYAVGRLLTKHQIRQARERGVPPALPPTRAGRSPNA